MSTSGEGKTYRLKLVEGDEIKATVTNIGQSGIKADTSPWSNVEIARLSDVKQNNTITVSSEVYTTVTAIDSGEAILEQKRGVYRRNHLPGDQLRVQGFEQASSSFVRAEPDKLRNLDNIFVPGIAVGSDVTVELTKIRDGTAIGLPVDVHDSGLSLGRMVTVETVAGQREATVEELQTKSGHGRIFERNISIKLSEPAPATGQMTVELTTETDDEIQAEFCQEIDELPAASTIRTTSVSGGHNQTQIRLDDSNLQIKAEFDHPCPIDGRAVIELSDRQDGIYLSSIDRYTQPSLQPGATYPARVYRNSNRAQIEKDDRKIPIFLVDNISDTGHATVRITEISDKIYGRIDGEIKSITIDDHDHEVSNVDIRDLSKL